MPSRNGNLLDTCGCGREKQKRSIQCIQCARTKNVSLCACGNRKKSQSLQCHKCYGLGRPKTGGDSTLAIDRERTRHRQDLDSLRRRYDEALKANEQLERELGVTRGLKSGLDIYEITAKQGSRTSEGTVVAVASDWHSEEIVTPGAVSGLNEFNPEIFRTRSTKFFQSVIRLTRLLQQDITIDTLILPLLGDFITNDIHGAENAELNAMQPTLALVNAQNTIISGIAFILKETSLRIILPCHSGNHARTTQTTRFGAENGHSLEYLLYCHLAAYFRAESRVEFIIPEGMHSYLRVYDQTIRFQHGHAVKYNGGVGGLYIPVNKAISQWNKAIHADLDVFGHFHQLRDGGNFICNGSLIGYNTFALSIKADYEKPKQALFLIDKKRGRTCTWPVLVQ